MEPPDRDERRAQKPVPHEWTAADRAELWETIAGDARIRPDDREAAFEACLRGDPEWRNASFFDREYEAREQGTEKRRGEITARVLAARNPRDRLAVGWDRKLETYFGQVWKERTEGGEMYYHLTCWFGRGRREVRTVDKLAARLGRFAEVPEAALAELRAPHRVTPLRTQTFRAPGGAPDDWLYAEPRRPDRDSRAEGVARNVPEHGLRPPQGVHPNLTRDL